MVDNLFWSYYSNKPHPQISAACVGELISAEALIRVNTVLSGIAMVLSSALKYAPHFWRKKLIRPRKDGTSPITIFTRIRAALKWEKKVNEGRDPYSRKTELIYFLNMQR